jgi:AraC-like DNA-binding protein
VDNLLAIRAGLRHQYGALLGQMSPVAFATDNSMSVKDLQFVQTFEQYISEHYQQVDLSRSSMAEKLYMTERQLNRKLSALVEHNFSEYLRKFRLRQSLRLLSDTHQSIAGIAENVGFATPTYFTRCFKAEYDVSPNQFRQQRQQTIA